MTEADKLFFRKWGKHIEEKIIIDIKGKDTRMYGSSVGRIFTSLHQKELKLCEFGRAP